MSDEQAEQRRQGSRRSLSRQDRRTRSKRRKGKRSLFFTIAGGTIALLLIVSFIIPSLPFFSNPRAADTTVAPTQGTGADVGTFVAETLSSDHIPLGSTRPAYNNVPPTSGPHFDIPAPWGIYNTQLADETTVHNLEHGGVNIHHNLTDPALITQLEDLISRQITFPGCFVLQPYDRIPEGTVALTSWQWVQQFDGLQTMDIQAFIDAHINRAPENFGADCGLAAQMAQ